MPKQTFVRETSSTLPPSDLQNKVVDKPVMFRGSGLHARTTEPGVVSPKFSRANTNIPLWSGDSATLDAPPPQPDVLTTQRFKGKVQVGDKHEQKRMDNFFVAKQDPKSPPPAAAGGAGAVDEPRSPSVRPDDDIHISRKGHPDHKQKHGLKPGDFTPVEEASHPRHFGKKSASDGSNTHSQTTNELVYHGKKPFPEKTKTSCTTAATDIGSPERTHTLASPEKLQQSSRFHESKRHTTNLTVDLHPKDNANAQEFDYDSRKKHPDHIPGNKSGTTLQYVFAPSPKKIDATYRPVAPFA